MSESFAKWLIGGMAMTIGSLASWGWTGHEEAQKLKLEKALIEIQMKQTNDILSKLGER